MANAYFEIFSADGDVQISSNQRIALLVNSINFFFPSGIYTLNISIPGLVADGTWLSIMLPSSFQAYGVDMLPSADTITLQRNFGGDLSGTLLIYRI